MKRRLLLSALSCVLALGLVTACNDEEEDLSGGDMGTETDGGGSGSDTSGGSGTTDPGTTEAVTIENYTLAFTFMVGDTEDTIPEGATIYISYGPQGQSWGGFIALDSSNSVTFATITTGTYDYKLVIYDGEDDVTWQNCAEITTTNQSFVVSEEDEGGQAITITLTSTLEEIVATEGQSSGGEDDPTINVTVALKLDGSRTDADDITTWYIDGFDWGRVSNDNDEKCTASMVAYDGDDYDYYYDFGEQDATWNYTFGITPSLYEWHSNLGEHGLAPNDTLKAAIDAVTDDSALGLGATQYIAGTEEEWDTYTYIEWQLNFYDMTDRSALEEAESLVVVLTVDYASVDNSTWTAGNNNVVTAVDLILDGETYCSLPTTEPGE